MSYVDEVYENVVAKNPNEPEFHQAVKEVLDSLRPVIDANEEKTIAENSVTTEEDIKEAVGEEDAQITEFQNNVEEITFLGEKHYAAQYTFKNYDVPFYGVTVYLVNKQDPCYLLAVNILGSDLDAVDQADQFFSVYTE